MRKHVLLGVGRLILPVPRFVFDQQVNSEVKRQPASLPATHHRVRDFTVKEIPNVGKPLTPAYISESLQMAQDRLVTILDELEKAKTYLWRGDGESVTWAYPVTVDDTPHRYTFNTGEVGNAAWAVDAVATPFVQGRYRENLETVTVETECAHCSQPITITFDRALNYHVEPPEADPQVFVPMVDFGKLEAPNIIDDFWRRSVFFWSEEHAKRYRRRLGGVRGVYLTLEQSVAMQRIVQNALFAFDDREP